MTQDEKKLARNIRERDRLRAKRALLPKPTVEEKRAKRIEAARKKREYNKQRMRNIRQQDMQLVKMVLETINLQGNQRVIVQHFVSD